MYSVLYTNNIDVIILSIIPWAAVDSWLCPSNVTVWAGLAESAGGKHKAHRRFLYGIFIGDSSGQAVVMVSDDLVKLQDIYTTTAIYV